MVVFSWARAPRRTRPRGAYWLSAASWVKALKCLSLYSWGATLGGRGVGVCRIKRAYT